MNRLLIGLSLAALAGATLASAAQAQTIARDESLPTQHKATVGQIEDADVKDSAGRRAGEVEHVLLDSAGKPTAVVIEIDRPGPDKKVVVALADVTVTPQPKDDDMIVHTKLTKAQLTALPDWKG